MSMDNMSNNNNEYGCMYCVCVCVWMYVLYVCVRMDVCIVYGLFPHLPRRNVASNSAT